MKNNIVVYTAIFGTYDQIKDPKEKVEGVDYVCFTDNPALTSRVFNIVVQRADYRDSTRNARMRKILSHKYLPEYKYTVWVDGNIEVKEMDLRSYIRQNLTRHHIALFAHPERNCIYQEILACTELKKDDLITMEKQINRYRADSYPINNGLIATGVILRKSQERDVINLENDWWKEIKNGSKRDQLSFNYVAWKNKLKYKILNGNIRKNEYFIIHPHMQEKASMYKELEKKDEWIKHLEKDIEELNNEIARLNKRYFIFEKLRKFTKR